MVSQILASFAEMERNLIRERTKAGLVVAKINGKRIGTENLRKKAGFLRGATLDGLLESSI